MSQGGGRFTSTALKRTDQPNTEAVEHSLTLDCRAYLDLALDPLPSSLYGSFANEIHRGWAWVHSIDSTRLSIPSSREMNLTNGFSIHGGIRSNASDG